MKTLAFIFICLLLCAANSNVIRSDNLKLVNLSSLKPDYIAGLNYLLRTCILNYLLLGLIIFRIKKVSELNLQVRKYKKYKLLEPKVRLCIVTVLSCLKKVQYLNCKKPNFQQQIYLASNNVFIL